MRPTLVTMLWRGLRRRCAWCGGRGAFFTGWFAKQDRCRTCGIGWRRGYEGFELGALMMSAVISMGALVVALGVAVVVTSPDIPVFELVVALGVGALLLPILLYPVTYTVWQAIDLAMRPPDRDDPSVPPARR